MHFFLLYPVQGVSEFERQTFRADSIIKKSIKLLIHMGSKMLSLRDNHLLYPKCKNF
jgi:hypothetical protein